MSTFNSLQTHRLEKPYDWVTWKPGLSQNSHVSNMILEMAFPLGFGLSTDSYRPIVTNSQRSDSPRCEAHLDIKLHFERALEYSCEGSSESGGACRRTDAQTR